MFSPCLFLYRFPICPYTLFYSLYIYIRPQFNSLCKNSSPTWLQPSQAQRVFRPIYSAHCVRAKGMRAFEGVTVTGAKGVLDNNSFTHLQSCSSYNPKRSWVSISVFTTPFKEIQDDRVDSVSHLGCHLIIMEIMVLRFQYCYFLLLRIPLKQKMINLIVMFPGFDSGDV